MTADRCRGAGRPGRPGAVGRRVGRRRLAWAAAGALAVLALALPVPALAGRTVAGAGSPAPSAKGASLLPVEVAAGQGTFYVVRPGDTLRSIAERLAPHEVHRAEARLTAELGSSHVVPGEHVPVP